MLELYRLELETQLAAAERERRLTHVLSLRAAHVHAPARQSLRPRLAALLLALADRLDPAAPGNRVVAAGGSARH